MQNPKRWYSRVLNCAKYNKGYTMDTLKQIIQDIKVSNSLQGQANIGSRCNNFGLSEEDIKILTFASKPIKENVKHEELQFDQNVFKKPSIYETLG